MSQDCNCDQDEQVNTCDSQTCGSDKGLPPCCGGSSGGGALSNCGKTIVFLLVIAAVVAVLVHWFLTDNDPATTPAKPEETQTIEVPL
jgi:hypothetical protein